MTILEVNDDSDAQLSLDLDQAVTTIIAACQTPDAVSFCAADADVQRASIVGAISLELQVRSCLDNLLRHQEFQLRECAFEEKQAQNELRLQTSQQMFQRKVAISRAAVVKDRQDCDRRQSHQRAVEKLEQDRRALDLSQHQLQEDRHHFEVRQQESDKELAARSQEVSDLKRLCKQQEALLAEREARAIRREESLDERERAVAAAEAFLVEERKQLQQHVGASEESRDRETLLARRDEAVAQREARVTRLEEALVGKEARVAERERAAAAAVTRLTEERLQLQTHASADAELRDAEASRHAETVAQREVSIAEREESADAVDARLAREQRRLEEQEALILQRQHEHDRGEASAVQREESLMVRQTRLEDGEVQLRARQAELVRERQHLEELSHESERDLAVRNDLEGLVSAREQRLAREEQALSRRQLTLEKRERRVVEQEARAAEAPVLQNRERAVERREDACRLAEACLAEARQSHSSGDASHMGVSPASTRQTRSPRTTILQPCTGMDGHPADLATDEGSLVSAGGAVKSRKTARKRVHDDPSALFGQAFSAPSAPTDPLVMGAPSLRVPSLEDPGLSRASAPSQSSAKRPATDQRAVSTGLSRFAGPLARLFGTETQAPPP